MASYIADVTRDGRVWLIEVDGVGPTQARHLGELELMTEDLIDALTDDEQPQIEYRIAGPGATSSS